MNSSNSLLIIGSRKKKVALIRRQLLGKEALPESAVLVCTQIGCCWKTLKSASPAIILIDMSSGMKYLLEFIYELKHTVNSFSSIPIMCVVPARRLTGRRLTDECLQHGADDVLSYPFSEKLLIKRISVLTHKRVDNTYTAGLADVLKRSFDLSREAEKRFLAIFNNTADGFAVVSDDGKILEANRALETVTETDSGRLRGRSVEILGIEVEQIERMVRRAGPKTQCEYTVISDIDYHGQKAFLLQFTDCGRSRQYMAKELGRAREHYKHLVDHMPGGVYLATLEKPGRVIYMSPVAETLLGFSYSEYEQDCELFSKIIHPEDRENVIKRRNDFLERRHYFSLEYRIKRKNRQYIWIHEEARILYDHNGMPLSVQGLIIEITQHKQVELELLKLWRAVDQSPTLIMVMDEGGRIEYANPTLYQKTGYTSDEVLGRTAGFLYPQRNELGVKFGEMKLDWIPQTLRLWIWKRLRRGETWQGETLFKRKDGELIWIHMTVSPVKGTCGTLTHYVAVIEDITERKENEIVREDVERITRHDIKGPLNGIINIPKLLADEGNLTEKQRAYLDMIHNGGKKILSIVNNSLNLFQIEQGTYQLDPHPVDLLALLQQVVAHYETRMKNKQIVLVLRSGYCEMAAIGTRAGAIAYTEKKNDRFCIYGEELLSFTMLCNLIENAVEASPFGSDIELEIVETGHIEVSITNRGTVPEHLRADFFKKYVTHGKKNGHGIGTYSAKLSARVQGGDIELLPGEDTTTIKVRLPKA